MPGPLEAKDFMTMLVHHDLTRSGPFAVLQDDEQERTCSYGERIPLGWGILPCLDQSPCESHLQEE